jgi:hypothetical protein
MQPNWILLGAAVLLSLNSVKGKASKSKAPLLAPKSASVLDDEIAASKLTSLAVAMCPFAEEPITFDLHLAQMEAATSKLGGMTIYRKSASVLPGPTGVLAARRSNANGGRSSSKTTSAPPGTLIFAPALDGAAAKNSGTSEAFSSPFGSVSGADLNQPFVQADFGLVQPIVPGRLIFGPRTSLNEQIPIAVSASYGKSVPVDNSSKLPSAQDPTLAPRMSSQQADAREVSVKDPFNVPSAREAGPIAIASNYLAATSSNSMSLSLPSSVKITKLDEKLIGELEFEPSSDGVFIGLNSTIDVNFVKDTLIPYFLSEQVLDRKSALSVSAVKNQRSSNTPF